MNEFLKRSILVTALVTLEATISINAFVPAGVRSLKISHSTPPLYSSFDDDELSRLIGKRDKIKRKKREEFPSEDDLMESLSTESLNFDEMPEFQTKRVKREPKKSKKEDKKKTESFNESTFNDYYADYVS
jgi:hypothetical protein